MAKHTRTLAKRLLGKKEGKAEEHPGLSLPPILLPQHLQRMTPGQNSDGSQLTQEPQPQGLSPTRRHRVAQEGNWV